MGTYVLFSAALFVAGILLSVVKNKEINRKACLSSFGLAVLLLLFNYVICPVISWNTPAGYGEAIFFFLAMAVPLGEAGEDDGCFCCGIVFILLLILVGIWISGWDFFRSGRQQKILQVTETADSALRISPVPLEKMSIINAAVAHNLAAQKLGELQNKYVLGEFRKQSLTGSFRVTEFNGRETDVCFDNQIVFVAPLEHGSVFKWFRNRYTEGYALVNASDPSEYYLVKAVDGKELKLRYLQSACLGENIKRHVQMLYPHQLTGDYGIELDNHGMPFNTVTMLENEFGFGTKTVSGTLVVDVQSGEIKEYSVENTPAWVNLIYPQEIVEEQIYYWGEYIHGWWNPSQRDRKEASPGMDIVYDPDGCSYYAGIQAKKTDSNSQSTATVGYMMVDTRSGEATLFKRDGINETTAKAAMLADPSVANAVQLGTVVLDDATFYLIDGLHTYFATFISPVDEMPKYFGFCNADTKEIVGIGSTLQEAKAAYLKSAAQYRQRTGLRSNNDSKNAEQTVTIAEKVQEGNCYFFRFKETGDRVFYAYGELLPEVRWKAEKVVISYTSSEDKLIPLTGFTAIK